MKRKILNLIKRLDAQVTPARAVKGVGAMVLLIYLLLFWVLPALIDPQRPPYLKAVLLTHVYFGGTILATGLLAYFVERADF
jgi:hypothetical protein